MSCPRCNETDFDRYTPDVVECLSCHAIFDPIFKEQLPWKLDLGCGTVVTVYAPDDLNAKDTFLRAAKASGTSVEILSCVQV